MDLGGYVFENGCKRTCCMGNGPVQMFASRILEAVYSKGNKSVTAKAGSRAIGGGRGRACAGGGAIGGDALAMQVHAGLGHLSTLISGRRIHVVAIAREVSDAVSWSFRRSCFEALRANRGRCRCDGQRRRRAGSINCRNTAADRSDKLRAAKLCASGRYKL
jgi:hypothetical protein